MVMVSLILALAVAQALRGLSEVVTSEKRFWPHTVWLAFYDVSIRSIYTNEHIRGSALAGAFRAYKRYRLARALVNCAAVGLWAWPCHCRSSGDRECHLLRFAMAPPVPNFSGSGCCFISDRTICQERQITQRDTVSPCFNACYQSASCSFKYRRINS